MTIQPQMRAEEPFLIVGAGSSGTTLLSMLLDRHPLIACGPELSVFNKRRIYGDYKRLTYHLPLWLSRGLSTDGQSEYREFFCNLNAYFCTTDDLIALARSSHNQRQFFDRFFMRYLTIRQKSIWGEKTPSNAYCVRQFVNLYPKARLLHVVRDGRDSVCSLLRRPGSSAYHSVSHWLYNVSSATACRDVDGYLEIHYEDLVSSPHRALAYICHHLGVEFEPRMLEAEDEGYWAQFAGENVHRTWGQNPFLGISADSVGRHSEDMPRDIENLFWRVRLTPFARKRLGVQHSSTGDLMQLLDYTGEMTTGTGRVASQHYRSAVKEWWLRFKRELRLERRIWLPLTYIRSFT